MTAHRALYGDGDMSCYACGAVADIVADADTHATLAAYQCRPGGWEHPPYILGLTADGAPILETCAAHPYAGCEIDAVRDA